MPLHHSWCISTHSEGPHKNSMGCVLQWRNHAKNISPLVFLFLLVQGVLQGNVPLIVIFSHLTVKSSWDLSTDTWKPDIWHIMAAFPQLLHYRYFCPSWPFVGAHMHPSIYREATKLRVHCMSFSFNPQKKTARGIWCIEIAHSSNAFDRFVRLLRSRFGRWCSRVPIILQSGLLGWWWWR